jgi:hypothetical protein
MSQSAGNSSGCFHLRRVAMKTIMKVKVTVEAVFPLTKENVLRDLGRIRWKKALIEREFDYYKEELEDVFWEPGTKIKYDVVEVKG